MQRVGIEKDFGFPCIVSEACRSTSQCGCTERGFYTCLEPKEKYFRGSRSGHTSFGTRGDIFLSTFDEALDMGISTMYPLSDGMTGKASSVMGAAGTARDEAKRNDYASLKMRDYSFVTFNVVSCGFASKEGWVRC
jgi:hypothetical protein